MAAAEEGAQPLMYQTVALKVSIHCEGCKKKVKKVLHTIEGVYKTDIDTQQHKVSQPRSPSANASGGGGGGKKKKKGKGGNNGNANANGGDGAGATAHMSPHDAPANPATGNASQNAPAVVDAGAYPPATAMSYPGYYGGGAGAGHMPYAMSYSTSHPHRSSAYYHPMAGAAYTGGAGYYYSTAPVSAAPGSYYMFSEENANACSVM
uniref:Uncharacterized protein n=1 Tax=Aegilops tauschii TaxID=37682 RepID=M8BQ94_AEGTA